MVYELELGFPLDQTPVAGATFSKRIRIAYVALKLEEQSRLGYAATIHEGDGRLQFFYPDPKDAVPDTDAIYNDLNIIVRDLITNGGRVLDEHRIRFEFMYTNDDEQFSIMEEYWRERLAEIRAAVYHR